MLKCCRTLTSCMVVVAVVGAAAMSPVACFDSLCILALVR